MTGPFDTPERIAFRETLRRFVAAEIAPHADAWDEAGAIPPELHRKVAGLGLFGLGFAEESGGLGFDDPFMRCAGWAEIAYGGAGGVAAQLGGRMISTGLIERLGTRDQRLAVLPAVLSGRESSSLAVTEPGGGSDVAALRTRARREGNGWRLDGEKTFITAGLASRWYVVAARTGGEGIGGVSLFLVEWGIPGFERRSVGRKQGWWCSDTAALSFDDCRLPAEALLGPENGGFLAAMENFNTERLVMTAQMLGMMRLCHDAALGWARERQTFGKPLIRHQVIAHKLVEMSARIDWLGAWTDRLCWDVSEGRSPVAGIAKAKMAASKALEFCASEAMQVFGGAAYLRGNPVERVWRELKVMAIGGGSEEVMRDLAARQMRLAG